MCDSCERSGILCKSKRAILKNRPFVVMNGRFLHAILTVCTTITRQENKKICLYTWQNRESDLQFAKIIPLWISANEDKPLKTSRMPKVSP